MRLDELLRKRRENVTQDQYQRLRLQEVFVIEYSDTGWNFGELEQLSEAQARRLLKRYQKARKYESENKTASPIREIIVNLAAETEEPEWPEELQGYHTPYLFEAFLRQKFGIEN